MASINWNSNDIPYRFIALLNSLNISKLHYALNVISYLFNQ
uniref:Uncharacterized protein n=1 Tax=Heterorhabditis bacteriophora TaxID=37862 RepID=A0A1I7X4I2_HETBA